MHYKLLYSMYYTVADFLVKKRSERMPGCKCDFFKEWISKTTKGSWICRVKSDKIVITNFYELILSNPTFLPKVSQADDDIH